MSHTSAHCPFVAGPMITDSRCFVGRKDELRTLAGKMCGRQPVSVNVVGERRIGKSSLLYYFSQTWEQRVEDPARFVVVYLDLQGDDPQTEGAFYQALAKTLGQRPTVNQTEALRLSLNQLPDNHKEFAAVLEQFAAHELLPIFCLDEFEMLLKYPEQFSDSFFDRLRGFMNANFLMFILSSRKPVDVCAGEHQLTSAFFNLGHVLRLAELTEKAADELVNFQLPGSHILPALNSRERQLARKWGGRHPYLLQLAAGELFDARQDGKNTAWAKKRFEEQSCRLQTGEKQHIQLWSLLRPVVWNFPRWLGSRPFWIGRIMSDIGKWITGMIIIFLGLALIFGLAPIASMIGFVLKKIGLGH